MSSCHGTSHRTCLWYLWQRVCTRASWPLSKHYRNHVSEGVWVKINFWKLSRPWENLLHIDLNCQVTHSLLENNKRQGNRIRSWHIISNSFIGILPRTLPPTGKSSSPSSHFEQETSTSPKKKKGLSFSFSSWVWVLWSRPWVEFEYHDSLYSNSTQDKPALYSTQLIVIRGGREPHTLSWYAPGSECLGLRHYSPRDHLIKVPRARKHNQVEYAGYAGGCLDRRRVLLTSLPQSSIGQKRIAGLKN
jgi:hypothetical protein